MKKLILALSIAALSFSVSAEDEQSSCSRLADSAGNIMKLRQSGFEMAEMYKAHKDAGSELGVKLTIDAYKIPMFGTQKYKDESVKKFKNKWFMACVSR